MRRIARFPQNRDRFARLINFLKKILAICDDLGIEPVLSGSLAVFAYSGNREMKVNDIDLSCSEADFAGLMKVLNEKGIEHRLGEWHVLQVLDDDLKVEFDSAEYWFKDLQIGTETLQLGKYSLKMVDLNSLRELYRRGVDDKATKENETEKYEELREKYELLNAVVQGNM
jgi:hypothetical protein